jgi:methyl-accepting chemotaxis protein
MRKYSLRFLIALTDLLFVVLPLIVIFFLFQANTRDSSMRSAIALTAIIVLAVLTVVAIATRNFLLGGLLKGLKTITSNLEMVEQGNLNEIKVQGNINELTVLTSIISKILKEFDSVISEVHSSTFEVTHIISAVSETFKESAKNSHDISKTTEALAEGATHQAEDSELCYKMSTDLVEQVEIVSKSTDLMAAKAELVKNMTDFGKKSVLELLDKSKLSETTITEINNSID